MIDQQTTEEMIDAFFGWDNLENKLKKPGEEKLEVIDFCLIPRRKGMKFTSREQVLEKLTGLYERIEPTTPEEKFVQAELKAATYLLRALIGETFPFREYVEVIVGVTPQIIPEEVIQKQREMMEDRFKAVGYNPKKQSLKQFLKTITFSEKEAKQKVMQEINSYKKTLIPRVQEILGFGDLKIDYKTRPVKVKDYWRGWTSTKPDGSFLLRLNFHPNIKWRKGDAERIVIHEVDGHFVQGENIKIAISNKEINPFNGITFVHAPRTWVTEGTANAISYLKEVEELLSPYALLARDRSTNGIYVGNNAHIMINEGYGTDEVLKYVLDRDPFAEKKATLEDLDRRKNNPARRGYQYSYGSLYEHLKTLERLSPEKQKEYLKEAMLRYRTRDQLIEFANQLFSR
jgi:hypothetical protein